jgi:hypothetical protein
MKKVYMVGISDNEGFHHLIAFEDGNVAHAVAYGLNQYSTWAYYDVEPIEVMGVR